MSIKKYISELTYDQLAFAKETIESRIAEYEDSRKVVLFIISDTVCNVDCYAQNDWECAKAHLIQLIQAQAFTSDDIRNAPQITRVVVSEFEVGEWMSLNS